MQLGRAGHWQIDPGQGITSLVMSDPGWTLLPASDPGLHLGSPADAGWRMLAEKLVAWRKPARKARPAESQGREQSVGAAWRDAGPESGVRGRPGKIPEANGQCRPSRDIGFVVTEFLATGFLCCL
jgi:hypothetical protein